MGIPEGEEREKGTIFEEIMAENFSNLMININLHIKETQLTLMWINSKKSILRHVIVKMLKV